ncbi:uncharacterized protein LOC127733361 [Mytilus californianus]|uniref:uncharacterized protein LOC127733361 n=1 Tax=Mytilus californianus TaxID=6549 RepID=UPI0022469943|nr:uncharacterized protein LOC127733361 [Mytilus californianus]
MTRHLSILMIGVDSISRNNMIRYMPKTRHFLSKNLSALDYLGYNKVADNTFLYMVPMTTGKFVHELPLNTSLKNVSFDHEESTLNNTIIFFYSDHGIRFGQFRQTFIGQMEERLPFLFIILPQWFKVKYPEIYTNCKTNQQSYGTSPQ